MSSLLVNTLSNSRNLHMPAVGEQPQERSCGLLQGRAGQPCMPVQDWGTRQVLGAACSGLGQQCAHWPPYHPCFLPILCSLAKQLREYEAQKAAAAASADSNGRAAVNGSGPNGSPGVGATAATASPQAA